jgi:hypothetical protein
MRTAARPEHASVPARLLARMAIPQPSQLRPAHADDRPLIRVVAESEHDLIGLSRHGRNLRREVHVNCPYPPRLFLNGQEILASADDAGIGNQDPFPGGR